MNAARRSLGLAAAATLAGAIGLACSLSVAGLTAPAPELPPQGFGRWESQLKRCQLSWPQQISSPAQQSGCLSLRLDQTIEGMVRVRFINAAAGSRFASEELVFAGLLLSQDRPMDCQQGHCSPHWPMRLVVKGVASRRFDARGLAERLPSNQLARGSCQLEPARLRCQAESGTGQRWQALGQLSGSDPGERRQTGAAGQSRP